MNYVTSFLRDDSGAVTIDWVALTAGILLLGIAVVSGIFTGGVSHLTSDINATLQAASASDGTQDFSSAGTGG